MILRENSPRNKQLDSAKYYPVGRARQVWRKNGKPALQNKPDRGLSIKGELWLTDPM
jgi:hypothetical protein